MPGVGGSTSGQTYDWGKLRFGNGSMEANITEAYNSTNLWIDPIMKYWDNGFKDILYDTEDPEVRSYISSWQGIFVKSLKDNITIIREN